ncbi:PKD domain-containing protein [Mucilaginibacter myungsuensis]|uniref:PKD domain-containing protein n=1 Tax=Mucilaginibacter myungsuensis TaxID=649104 RepID=A0A929KRN5_9SPHI|nr:PKD domain-containing protein [Mucilaginibacter myungsuensis]MBE9660266.1 PKD domain-containing protein [Mucilaginibacter myungsuensis]MDN3600308.1 PKD domain-containing protein [Mucilaginibacter myungsuensis]
MKKIYPGIFLLIVLCLVTFGQRAFSQTIAVTNFDNSIVYSPGSSIGVPVRITNTGGNFIAQDNTFSLFLSNAAGVYPATPIATVPAFYITYINAVIPLSTLPGAGYKVKITSSSNPGAIIGESAPFAVAGGAAIKAGIEPTNSLPVIDDAVYGSCTSSQDNFRFDFRSTSTAGTTGAVTVVDETGATANVGIASLTGSFSTTTKTNFTAIVRAGNGLVSGTRAYTILNSTVNNNIGSAGPTATCLPSQGATAILSYKVDVSILKTNYPGNRYLVTWGDGTAGTLYNISELEASGGIIAHTFTRSSCGNLPAPGQNNKFEIKIQPTSPFCNNVGTPALTYATVSLAPINRITPPGPVTCTGAVSFTNTSYPGEDPNSIAGNCQDFAGARYAWSVDGTVRALNVARGTIFTANLTPGNHVIKLALLNNPNPICPVEDATYTICVQDPPKPDFTLSAPQVCASPGVTITNTSITDNLCSAPVFNWTVTAPAGAVPVTTSGGTTLQSAEPKFVFVTAGRYTLTLTMPDACGRTYTKTLPVIIDANPTVALSANVAFCGPQVLTFGNTAGSSTRVTYSGSGDPAAATYQWTVTPPAGAGAPTFINGTNANSQYPQISFPGFGNYTVTVRHTNSCGSPTASQVINIQQAPAVSAGADATVCASAGSFVLAGSISDMASVVSYQWSTNGDGTFVNGNSSLTPTYNLGTNDKRGGPVRLTLTVRTNLIGACSTIIQAMTLNVTPTPVVTSAATLALCSGNTLNYNITAIDPASTFVWTATGTTNITGFAGGGTGNSINDLLTNSDPINTGTVTYTITPTANGCPGKPFTLTVTVDPKPVLTLSNLGICSGRPAGITLNPAMRYSWTSAVISGTVSGNGGQFPAINTAGINDILTNTGTTQAVVRYTVTPISASGCPGDPATVDVTVEPQPTQPVFSQPTVAVCDVTSYQLNGTNPIVGAGRWTETSGKTVTFSDATNAASTVSGLVAGTIYQFTWTISTACSSNDASFQLTNNLPSVGGTASSANTTICYNSNGTITLSGHVGSVMAWQQSTDNGVTWQTIAGNNTNPSYAYNSLTQTTAFRAVVQNGSCAIANSAQVVITVNPPTVVPNAGADQTLCNQNTVTLQGNSPGASTGMWTQKAGPTAGVTITDPTSPNTTVTGLTGGQTYTFTWTIMGQPPCGNLFDDVVITNQSLMTNTISYTGNTTICAGTSVTIGGSTPSGGTPPYTYIWESSVNGGTSWVTINGQTGQNITVMPLQNTEYRRTVFSNLNTCSVVSNSITINTQVALANNSISTTVNPVCYNTTAALITGSTPTGGDGIYFYTWQQSTDGVNFTTIANATGKDYQPGVLTANVVYRRSVRTTLCSGALASTSAPLTINVTLPLVANFTATKQADCAPFNISSLIVKATPDNNAQTYTWFANNVQIGTGLLFPGYTITGQGQTVNIKLVITSTLGCPDASFSLDFSTTIQSTAAFTIDKTTGCGPLAVNFTNTSTPIAGGSFTWDFGDGSPVYNGPTPPAHTFQPDPNGRDITYTIKLIANGCSPTTDSKIVTVYPAKPAPIIDPGPLTGCAPYAITVKNLTLGTNTRYDYYLFDENNVLAERITRTDKSDVTFNAIAATSVQKRYTVYMEAAGLCGATNRSIVYPITITPSGIQAKMTVTPTTPGGLVAGCAPFEVNFHNLSTGGRQYVYNIYDANHKLIEPILNNGLDPQPKTFLTPGTYYVSIGVFSNCSTGIESAKTQIIVYPLSAPNFTADVTTGCTELTVKFTNTTPALANSSISYVWDFGDGSPLSTAVNPTHTYAARTAPYNVKLTARSSFGCMQTETKVEMIKVNLPPQSDFTASQGLVTEIPNYTFNFQDKSKLAPVSWFWEFGDKTTSTLQNPSHTYADTGRYVVKLTTYSQFGCTDGKTYTVQVKGVPGQLFVPNAFMPSSLSQELRKFTVKGSGLKTFAMRIFNIWGQMVFETTKLNEKGEPIEFWDGTFKGADAQQGAYAWEISATFINGTDWKGMVFRNGSPKRAGTLNLIR